MSRNVVSMVGVVVVVAIAITAWAIWSDGDSGDSDGKLTIGHLPIADCAQLFVAVDQGYFTDEGLEVELIAMSSGLRTLEALGTGDVDIAFSAVAPLILARARGLEYVAVTGGPTEDAMHVLPEEDALEVVEGHPVVDQLVCGDCW